MNKKQRSKDSLTYALAGVDIDSGDQAVARILPKVRSTFSKEVISDIGGFAGMFAPDLRGIAEPVFVSSTDGVGTKAKIATWSNKYETIGIDLVAMCVDDLVCTGAKPLFMLDYVSIGKLEPEHIEKLVGGIAQGCLTAKTSLIGGEMAEHPGAMDPGDFDLAGFAVGIVDRSEIWGPHRVRVGHKLIGLASPNLRSNGFSLVRAAFFSSMNEEETIARGFSPCWVGSSDSLFDALLEPSVIYSHAISTIGDKGMVASCAHITGGGMVGNLPRALPKEVGAEIALNAFEVPRIFREIQKQGNVSEDEMFRVFNMGVGMILVVDSSAEKVIRDHIEDFGIPTYALGVVTDIFGGVRFG